MARVVIVCGYDRLADIGEYSERVAAQLIGERFDALIVSGGFTNAASDDSEAALMAFVFRRALPHSRVLLEERALTTLDNVVYSQELASRLFGRVEHFRIFCDSAHRAKVTVLSWLVLAAPSTVSSVYRPVAWYVRAFEPLSIVAEAVGALVPQVRRALSALSARVKKVDGRGRRSARREAA